MNEKSKSNSSYQEKSLLAGLQMIPLHEATAYLPATFQAQSTVEGKPGARWEMELYKKGFVFAGHWRWGDIIIDLDGVQPTRQDVFALYNHNRYEAAGFTDFVGIEKDTIKARGKFLEGPEEKTAAMIRSRLEQKAPMQCSGGFVPKRVERVEAGVKVLVNGIQHDGPKTIFRETDIIEASFTEMGWYNESNARLAASADAGAQKEIAVVITASNANRSRKMNEAFLASLKETFGADKALELLAANPQAEKVEAFGAEMMEVIKAQRLENGKLSASLTEKETALKAKADEVNSLTAQLTEAKKRPAVVTAGGDAPGDEKPAAEAGSLKAQWDKNENDVQAEFGTFERFEAYQKRFGKGE